MVVEFRGYKSGPSLPLSHSLALCTHALSLHSLALCTHAPMATVELHVGNLTFVRCLTERGTPAEFGAYVASYARNICTMLSPAASPEDRMRAFDVVAEFIAYTENPHEDLEIADEWQYTVRVQQLATAECTVEALSLFGDEYTFDSLNAFQEWSDEE